MRLILITIPWFHPAYKAGGPIQSIANMVEHFSHDVTYKIFTSNTDLDGSLLLVQPDKWIKYNDNTNVWYSSKQNSEIFKKEIKKNKAEVIFINGIYSFNYNLWPLLYFRASKKILSARGMLHPGALSQKSFKKIFYLSLWKILGLHNKCDFHASNEEEKKYIQDVFGNKIKVYVAQNFPRVLPLSGFPNKTAGSLKLVSIALISRMKNHLLVLKALNNCIGNVTYTIFGPVKDREYWKDCEQLIKILPPNITVNYLGDIPPGEVQNALLQNHVFILPSKSENFGHSIYEALSSGRPVITSNKTPWNNLQQSDAGLNVTPENIKELSEAINHFTFMDNNDLAKWNKGANNYASKAIDINDIKEQYRQMFFE